MLSSSGWETVTGKKGLKNASKGLKRTSLENMPRIQPSAPVKESPTIYHAFLEEELRKERKLLEAEKINGLKEAKKSSSNQLYKKKEKRLPLKESLLSIDFNEIESLLRETEASFPKNPEIWLKNLASFLNYKLDHINDSDPILADKPQDYPFCLLSAQAKEFFLNSMKNFHFQVYESLIDHCIECMMNAISKDQSSFGYRLVIQILLQSHPEVILNNLSKFENLIQKNAGRPLRSLCILWAVGQVGGHSLAHGIKIWFTLMFGLINVKNLNSHVICYLESLFVRFPKLEEGFGVVTKTEYFKYFGELYSELSPLPADVRKRLHQLHPKVKAISWGNVSKNMSLFFSGYLSRLTADCHEAKKIELLQCLFTCLQNDVQSFAQWTKDYHKTMTQSSLLLKYIKANMEKFQTNRRVLIETIKAFQKINVELKSKLPKDTALQSCEESCRAILLNFKKGNLCMRPSSVTVVIIIMTLLAGDVYYHNSFSDTLSHRCLSYLGITSILNKTSISSIGENISKSLNTLCNFTSPLISLVTAPIIEFTQKYRLQLQTIFTKTSEKMVQLTPQLLQQLDTVCQAFLASVYTTYAKVAELHCSIQSFVLDSILVDNIQHRVSQVLLVFHDKFSDLLSGI